MLTKAKDKKGISLMVLVITIIVLSILAATVITSLSSTNVISEASRNVLKSNLATMQDIATTYMVKNYDSVDMKREYSITEFGITDERFKEYETIAVVKAGKVYIKSNAPESVQEVAQELNMLIDGVISNTGNVTLARTATTLSIYGNSVQNGTPSASTPVAIESVGDKTNNLFNKDTIMDNKKLYKGELQDDVERFTSDYIDCTSFDSVSINLCASFAWYDENKTILSFENNSSTIFRNYVKPSGAVYLRMDFLKSVVEPDQIMCVAGAYTSSTIPAYEAYGYEIPVTVTGKNLFDINADVESSSQSSTVTVNGNQLTTPFNEYASFNYTFNFVKTSQQKQFTIKYNLIQGGARVGIKLYNANKELIDDNSIAFSNLTYNMYYKGYYSNSNNVTFTLPEEAKYIRVFFVSCNNDQQTANIYSDIQLEEGSTATEYEPYNGKTYNIYLSEPLRKVSNTADYIDCTTGEVVRKIRVKDATGTKSIVESFELLKTPIKENITIENMNFTDKKLIFVETSVTPSSIEVKY